MANMIRRGECMADQLIVRYGEDSRMILRLDSLFPRTKAWLAEFERTVLPYCAQREEVIDALYAYLTETAIPKLPEERKKLAQEVEDARVHAVDKESRNYALRLNRTLQRWPKYCAAFEENRKVIES